MGIPIISTEAIRRRARAAFERGLGRESHDMNWHAPALAVWLEEYDRLVAKRKDGRCTEETLQVSKDSGHK